MANNIGERYPVYELMTYFAAYTGPRAEEIAGLEVGDLVFAPGADGVRARVEIDRAKKRKGGVWVSDTLKSEKSGRAVPLPGWLAARMENYVLSEHPYGNPASATYDPTAPLWPNRTLGGARRRGCRAVAPLDSLNLLTPALTTRTCCARPWRLLGYRRTARRRKMLPPCVGSACTIYATPSPRSNCRRAFTLCRCRSGWGAAPLR